MNGKAYQTFFRYDEDYDFKIDKHISEEFLPTLSPSNDNNALIVTSSEEEPSHSMLSSTLKNFIVSYLVRHDKNRLRLYNEILSCFTQFGLKNNSQHFKSSQWQHLFNTLLTDYVYFKYSISSIYRDGMLLGSALNYKDLELEKVEIDVVKHFQIETIKQAKYLIVSIRNIFYDTLRMLWFPNTCESKSKTIEIKELAVDNMMNKHFSDFIGSQVTQNLRTLFDAVNPDKPIGMISHTKYTIPVDMV